MTAELTYTIKVKTTEGANIRFTGVKAYENRDGLVHFIDTKTGQPVAFPTSDVNIVGEKR